MSKEQWLSLQSMIHCQMQYQINGLLIWTKLLTNLCAEPKQQEISVSKLKHLMLKKLSAFLVVFVMSDQFYKLLMLKKLQGFKKNIDDSVLMSSDFKRSVHNLFLFNWLEKEEFFIRQQLVKAGFFLFLPPRLFVTPHPHPTCTL